MRRVLAVIFVIVGVAAITVGGIGVAAFGVEGKMQSSSSALESSSRSHALLADILSIEAGFPGSSALGEVTIGAEAVGGKPLFIGYGTRRSVDKYLEGVGFDAVAQQGSAWETRTVPGVVEPDDPLDKNFWLGSSTGFDAEVAFKIPSEGQASLVVMNQNATAPVEARIAIGYQSELVFPLSVGAIAVGALLVVVGLVLLRPRRQRAVPAESGGQDAVQTADADEAPSGDAMTNGSGSP